MSMRAHVVKGGVILNTIIAETLDILPDLIDADLHGGTIGDTWDGQKVIPATPKPQKEVEVPLAELLKEALLSKGLLEPTDIKPKG